MTNIKFNDMNISDKIKKALAEKGYEEATSIQSEAIGPILEGLDVLGLAQTGTGKTGAFAIPIIEKVDVEDNDIQTLILCPTRELVLQICEEMASILKYKESVRIAAIYGGQQIEKQIFLLKKKPQIIVGTPGRILDHLRRRTVKLGSIKTIVLDEADEMLNMGFREDLNTILESASAERQTVLFSATMSKDIKKIAESYQHDPIVVEIKHETMTVSEIHQYYIEVNESKKIDLLDRLVSGLDTTLGIVFCNTKKKVDEIAASLQVRGYSVEALHGDLRQSARDNVLNKFRNGKLQLLVATDVAARGIDVNDIEIVFNYDIPIDDEYYVHRIGRTGRAGKEGTSITFITSREYSKLKYIEKYTKAKIEKFVIPTVDSMVESKVNKLLSKVEAGNVSEYTKFVEAFLDENSDLTIADIAYYLLEQQLGNINKDEIETGVSREDSVRMFINIGKMDKLNKSDLEDFIISKASVTKKDITDIELFDKFSFFNIPEELSDEVLTNVTGTEYNKRTVAVEMSSGRPKKRGSFGPQGNRDRDRNGRRDSRRGFTSSRGEKSSSSFGGERRSNFSKRDRAPRNDNRKNFMPRDKKSNSGNFRRKQG
jgi:ATP-dependent RNA helicase DeaD